MVLKGWSQPLPDWIVKAISSGTVLVYFDEKSNAELLKGTALDPNNTIVNFL